jgi:membrane protease YdiL (CAAX protease family)
MAATVLKSLADGIIVSVLFLVPFLLLVYFVPVFGAVSPKSEAYWSSWTVVLNDAFSMLVSVAIFEELFFRGFLQDNLARLLNDRKRVFGVNLGWGYLLACALFALPHILSWGKTPLGLMTFFSSLVFGWLFAKRRCIAGAVVCHTAFNIVPAVFDWIIRN